MIDNILNLNNYQFNEMIIGTFLLVIIYIILQFINKNISFIDTIYCGLAFALLYYLSTISYNFVVNFM